MAIDKSGQWWKGSLPEDMDEYIHELSQQHIQAAEFRHSSCQCGSLEFNLRYDANEGCAVRICSACGDEQYICDSEENVSEAEFESWVCVDCGGSNANLGVGYALRPSNDVQWVYVVSRCCSCGLLGCYADWKVDYSPSIQLLERA